MRCCVVVRRWPDWNFLFRTSETGSETATRPSKTQSVVRGDLRSNEQTLTQSDLRWVVEKYEKIIIAINTCTQVMQMEVESF